MQQHQLQQPKFQKERKRIGRGGKKGTYSGRGMKGQKSRAGRHYQPIIRETVKKYPKLRGYSFNARKDIFEVVLTVASLDKRMEAGAISPKTLLEAKVISKIKGRTPKVRLLGTGHVSKKFQVEGCSFTTGAKEKIEKAGGSVV